MSNLAATFCSQPHKQASAQGQNNDINNKALWPAADCKAKVAAELNSRPFISYTSNLKHDALYRHLAVSVQVVKNHHKICDSNILL